MKPKESKKVKETKKSFKINLKSILIAIGSIIVIACVVLGIIFLVSTKSQRYIRRSENPWNVETNKNIGRLMRTAIKNPKYTEDGKVVTITGKDAKSDVDIEIVLIIGTDKSISLSSYKQGPHEMTLAQFVSYLEQYA